MSIDPSARITCDELVAGPGLIVRAGARIEGGRVVLGRNAFIDEHAVIGGGSAGDFTAGDHFHLGMFAQVNTARPVTVGDEVGLGIGTRIFTHGAYLSEWDGFPVSFEPVSIGDRVWLPNAVVMPGVSIGSDVVVAAGSVVTRSLPSGVLAAGSPAEVIREGWPEPSEAQRVEILERICAEAGCGTVQDAYLVTCNGAIFDVAHRDVIGHASEESERLRNQMRRHGIRFAVDATDGGYAPWTA